MAPAEGKRESKHGRNSFPQESMVTRILPAFADMIESMTLSGPGHQVVRIADLGCSSGPESIVNVEEVVAQLRTRCREGRSEVEIQVFFQDLPSNDFNSLFKHLFSQPNSEVEKVRNYMSAAVPGCHCQRLFPKNTINIVLSNFALHRLTKVPDAVRDKRSPAYNEGHTDIHRSSRATVEAYADQASKDLDNFLAARALEVVPGGMVFLMLGIRRGEFYPCLWDSACHLQEQVWNDLVLEGMVSAELRDSYNEPYYCRRLEEVKKALENYSTVFEVQKLKVHSQSHEHTVYAPDLRAAVRTQVMVYKAANAGRLEAHFGKAASDVFYRRMEQGLHDLFSLWKSTYSECAGGGTVAAIDLPFLSVGLRRKQDG